MKCSEVMQTDVVYCRASDTVASAALAMREWDVGFLPVLGPRGTLVGTLTDRDVATRLVAEGRAAEGTLVEEVMSPGAVTCDPDDDLEVAEEKMMQHRKARIVCADREGVPLGVISLSNVARLRDTARAATVLRAITDRGQTAR